MKKLLLFILVCLPFLVRAAFPSFNDFDTNYFVISTIEPKVSLTPSAILPSTNILINQVPGDGSGTGYGGGNVVLGGNNSIVNTVDSTGLPFMVQIWGGYNNAVNGNAIGEGCYAVIVGGNNNSTILAENSFIGGGAFNTINGGADVNHAMDGVIVGGYGNSIISLKNCFIGGGYYNIAGAAGLLGITSGATVGGGNFNISTNDGSTVMGGEANVAGGPASCVVGGGHNQALGYASTVSAGYGNNALGDYSALSGGQSNNVTSSGGYIGGGFSNTVSGIYATIPGGRQNIASGYYSFAAGLKAAANHQGSFVWSDSQSGESDAASDEFRASAHGGFFFDNGVTHANLGGSTNLPFTGLSPSAQATITSFGTNVVAQLILGTGLSYSVANIPGVGIQYTINATGTNQVSITNLSSTTLANAGALTTNNYSVYADVSGAAAAAIVTAEAYALTVGQNLTNLSVQTGSSLTNLILTNGINSTNFTLLTKTNLTTLINANGINSTNFTLLIGQNATNLIATNGINSTNFTVQTGTTVSNGVVKLVNTNGINSTNFTLQVGQNLTNDINAQIGVISNQVAGIQLTNNIRIAFLTNALNSSAYSYFSSFSGVKSAQFKFLCVANDSNSGWQAGDYIDVSSVTWAQSVNNGSGGIIYLPRTIRMYNNATTVGISFGMKMVGNETYWLIGSKNGNDSTGIKTPTSWNNFILVTIVYY